MLIDPLVTVYIPAYNHEKYVASAIRSVLEQSYRNIELIIINDGSTDNTNSEILKNCDACSRRFVRFEYRQQENVGLPATINNAIAWSQGNYLAGIASDDIWVENKISLQVEYLETHPKVAACFGNAIAIDADSRVLNDSYQPAAKSYSFRDILCNDYHLPALTACVRVDAYTALGGYDPACSIEDLYMWLKISHAGLGLHRMQQFLGKYRIHRSNTIKDFDRMLSEKRKVLDQYRDSEHYPAALREWSMDAFLLLSKSRKRKAVKHLLVAITQPFDRRFLKGAAFLIIPNPLLRIKEKLLKPDFKF